MTLQEASRAFDISIAALQEYEGNGLLQNTDPDGKPDGYREDDFRRLSFAQFLLHAGFTQKEAKRYLEIMNDDRTKGEQIRMLRKHRFELLESIHEKQQLLDQIDYMIREKKK